MFQTGLKHDKMRLFKIIGIPVVMSIVLVGIMLTFSSLASNYGVDYDNTSMQNIVNTSQDFENTAQEVKEEDDNRFSSVTDDIEGSILNQALKSLDVVKKSISSFGKIIAETVGMAGIGNSSFSNFLIGSLTSLVLIAIIIGIFTKALFKVEL